MQLHKTHSETNFYVADSNGETIARISNKIVCQEAVADLFAAAPDLLAALHDVIAAHDRGYDIPWGTARAALAKAEGKP